MKRRKGGGNLPPAPLRRRLLVPLLAVATAVVIFLMLIYRPGDPKRGMRAVRPAAEAASAVGGKADVMLLPSASSPPQR
jgi:hypothetical protein